VFEAKKINALFIKLILFCNSCGNFVGNPSPSGRMGGAL